MPEHELDLLETNSFFDNYQATGTAVMLANSVKLLPKAESKTGGQLFLAKVSLLSR